MCHDLRWQQLFVTASLYLKHRRDLSSRKMHNRPLKATLHNHFWGFTYVCFLGYKNLSYAWHHLLFLSWLEINLALNWSLFNPFQTATYGPPIVPCALVGDFVHNFKWYIHKLSTYTSNTKKKLYIFFPLGIYSNHSTQKEGGQEIKRMFGSSCRWVLWNMRLLIL